MQQISELNVDTTINELLNSELGFLLIKKDTKNEDVYEVLFEAGVKKEDIETLLCNLTEKIENLTKGYIGLDTYIETVEEKVGIKLKGE